MSPPVEPFGSALALDLGALVVAIESTQPQLAEGNDLNKHDQTAWDPALLASLGLNLLDIKPDADRDELLRSAADGLRQQLAGNTVTYVVNRNLKVSNHWIKHFIKHWINHCSFCAFCRDAGDPGAYWLREADLQQKAAAALAAGATELCIQDGLPLDQVLCPEKPTAREWVAVQRYACQHQRLGFNEFVLLPFVSASAPAALRSRVRRDQPVPAAMLRLKVQSRLLLGPWFRFHQPSWVKLTLAGATEALRWGCNHLGRLVRRRTTLYEAVA